MIWTHKSRDQNEAATESVHWSHKPTETKTEYLLPRGWGLQNSRKVTHDHMLGLPCKQSVREGGKEVENGP